jgi:hypothetical protein
MEVFVNAMKVIMTMVIVRTVNLVIIHAEFVPQDQTLINVAFNKTN